LSAGQLTGAVIILCSTRKPIIPIRYQVMINPVTDTVTTDRETKSEFQFFNGPFLDIPTLRKHIDFYIPNVDDRKSELATLRNISEAHAKKQPPTFIINSAADPLRDDGILYGEILQQAGVDCTIITAHGQLHDSVGLKPTRSGPTPKALVRVIASQIVEAVGGREGEDAETASAAEEELKPVTKKRRRHRAIY
jgi:acetyl esterase